MMARTDIAMIVDPVYKEILKRFFDNPDDFADVFTRSWYKLLHRDMGPIARYLGPWVLRRGAGLAGPCSGGDP